MSEAMQDFTDRSVRRRKRQLAAEASGFYAITANADTPDVSSSNHSDSSDFQEPKKIPRLPSRQPPRKKRRASARVAAKNTKSLQRKKTKSHTKLVTRRARGSGARRVVDDDDDDENNNNDQHDDKYYDGDVVCVGPVNINTHSHCPPPT